MVGLVHGLAGSGALPALVTVQLPDTTARPLYIASFGLGSVVGMATLSALAGLPMAHLGALQRPVSIAVGLASLGFGIWWGYPFIRWLV